MLARKRSRTDTFEPALNGQVQQAPLRLLPVEESKNRACHLLIIAPFFLVLALNGPEIRRSIETTARSTSGVHNINGNEVRTFPVCLPPRPEQREIVRRVDQLFALADQVEAHYVKAKQYVDSLKQSILAKAFRGELVPQDPNDAPATVLIERIQEARGTKTMDRSKPRATKSGAAPQNPVL
jgi:type I restriction enzyme, S subunit